MNQLESLCLLKNQIKRYIIYETIFFIIFSHLMYSINKIRFTQFVLLINNDIIKQLKICLFLKVHTEPGKNESIFADYV